MTVFRPRPECIPEFARLVDIAPVRRPHAQEPQFGVPLALEESGQRSSYVFRSLRRITADRETGQIREHEKVPNVVCPVRRRRRHPIDEPTETVHVVHRDLETHEPDDRAELAKRVGNIVFDDRAPHSSLAGRMRGPDMERATRIVDSFEIADRFRLPIDRLGTVLHAREHQLCGSQGGPDPQA